MDFNFLEKKEPLSVFSLAGLADIILLLLIFFLLTSNFIPQFGIQVTLPQTDASTPAEATYVNVAITEDGRFYVEHDEVTREALMAQIRDVRGERQSLLLRADRAATVDQFAAVAGVARALDLRVLMATDREDLRP